MARVLGWYAVVVVLLAAVRVAVPATGPEVTGATSLASVAAIDLGVRRLRPERVGAWRCLQASLVLLGLGDILFLLIEADSPVAVPFPAASDLVALAGYLLLSVALFWIGRPVAPQRDETSLIDVISLTLSGSLVVWLTLVRPTFEGLALGVSGRLAADFTMVGYIAVFAAALRLALGRRRNVAVVLVAVATALFLVSEFYYGYQLVGKPPAPERRTDLGFIVLAAGCGAAALTRSMRDMASPVSGRHSLTPLRLALIALGLLGPPAVLVVEAARGPVMTGFAIGSVGAQVSLLVLVRLSMSGRAYAARAGREHAVRVASQAMVSAVNPADVLAGTRNALRSLRPAHGMVDVDLVGRSDVDQPLGRVIPSGQGGRGVLVAALRGSEAAMMFSAPARILRELADVLGSLADQAAVALQRIRLAEVAGAEERERYFRTLVLTSTDAILITRDGRIEYATPSADAMVGRSVLGELLDDVVRRPDRPGSPPLWPDVVDADEGVIGRPGGDVVVVVHRRDLTRDPTVRGVVTTLRDVTAERELQHNLAYRASHDELTGMANTRSWRETLSAEKDRRRGAGNGVAVVFIDIDNFKPINDHYGHPTGDQVLAELARRIRGAVRDGDLAARVGGDEFAVLLRRLPDVDDARAVARRLAEALSAPVTVDSLTIDCQASIGLTYSEGEERIDSLVRQADTALYTSKELGKGRWTEYDATQWAPRRSIHGGDPGEASLR